MEKLNFKCIEAQVDRQGRWLATAILDNGMFANTENITGEIGTGYYCENLKTATDTVLRMLKMLNIEIDKRILLDYKDKECKVDTCPEQFQNEYMQERERLYSF